MLKPFLLIGSTLILAACGSSAAAVTASTSASPTPSPSPSASTAPAAAAVNAADNPSLGKILTDANGMTLYVFEPDRGGHPTCTGACAGVWRPLLSGAGTPSPTPGPGITGAVATVARSEGQQVTYNGWPLYTFTHDKAPGDATGQGVVGFGGKWSVATPATAVAASAQTAPPPASQPTHQAPAQHAPMQQDPQAPPKKTMGPYGY